MSESRVEWYREQAAGFRNVARAYIRSRPGLAYHYARLAAHFALMAYWNETVTERTGL